jgi:AcrR family transcriptional regulator
MTTRPFPKVADTAEERRAHIVEAAVQLIAQRGLAGVSVRTVADRAGCSRGLVEHYFRSKADLIMAANRRVNEAYLERLAAAMGSLNGLAALEAQLRNLLPFTTESLDEWRVRTVFFRQGSTEPLIAKDNNESFHAVYNEILGAMRHAQQHGEIPAWVPVLETSEMVLFFVIGVATVCLTSAQLREKRPLDRRVEMLIALLKTGNVIGLQVGDPEIEY